MEKAISDYERLDWMEDYPEKAIFVLEREAESLSKGYGHMLRERIDEAMYPPKKVSE